MYSVEFGLQMGFRLDIGLGTCSVRPGVENRILVCLEY